MLEKQIYKQRKVRCWLALALILTPFVLVGIIDAVQPPANRADAPEQLALSAVYAVILFGPIAFGVTRAGWGTSLWPDRHALLSRLVNYGNAWSVLRQIDGEIAESRDVAWFGERSTWRFWSSPYFVILTRNWLVQNCPEGCTVIRLSDILWVFQRRRMVRRGWGMHRMQHGFRVWFEPGRWELVPLDTQIETDLVLMELLRRRPWMMTGMHFEWEQLQREGPGPAAHAVASRQRQWHTLDAAGQGKWRQNLMADLREGVYTLAANELDPYSPFERTLLRDRQQRGRRWYDSDDQGRITQFNRQLVLRHVLQIERIWQWLGTAAVFGVIALGGILFVYSVQDADVGADLLMYRTAVILSTIVGVSVYVLLRFRVFSFMRGLWRDLELHGRFRDVIKRIDADLEDLSDGWLLGRWPREILHPQPDCLALSTNWLIRLKPRGSVAIHLPDLAWIYKRVVPRLSWRTTEANVHQLGCILADGQERFITLVSMDEIDRLVEEILARCPAVWGGWRGEWLDVFEAGRSAIQSNLDARRERVAGMTPDQRDAWLDETWNDIQRAVLFVDPSHSVGRAS